MRTWVRSLALLSGLRTPCCCGCGVRPAAAAPIRPLAWELPYAAGAALKREKKKKKKKQAQKGGDLLRVVWAEVAGRSCFLFSQHAMFGKNRLT